MIGLVVLFSMAVVLLLALPVHSFDFPTSRSEGLGGATVLSEPTASAMVSIPGGAIEDRRYRLDMGYHRLFAMRELNYSFVAGAYRYGETQVALGICQFGGSDLYAEQTVKISGARRFKQFTAGAVFTYQQLSFGGGYSSLSAVSFGLGGTYRRGPMHWALVLDNLNSPKFDPDAPKTDPKCTLSGELKGKESYSMVGRATFESGERPQFGLGQIIHVSYNGSLFWGISTSPTKYGGGMILKFGRSNWTYATSYHPVLGFTHTFSLAYRLGNPPGGWTD